MMAAACRGEHMRVDFSRIEGEARSQCCRSRPVCAPRLLLGAAYPKQAKCEFNNPPFQVDHNYRIDRDALGLSTRAQLGGHATTLADESRANQSGKVV
jgi:hypothetical protein